MIVKPVLKTVVFHARGHEKTLQEYAALDTGQLIERLAVERLCVERYPRAFGLRFHDLEDVRYMGLVPALSFWPFRNGVPTGVSIRRVFPTQSCGIGKRDRLHGRSDIVRNR